MIKHKGEKCDCHCHQGYLTEYCNICEEKHNPAPEKKKQYVKYMLNHVKINISKDKSFVGKLLKRLEKQAVEIGGKDYHFAVIDIRDFKFALKEQKEDIVKIIDIVLKEWIKTHPDCHRKDEFGTKRLWYVKNFICDLKSKLLK